MIENKDKEFVIIKQNKMKKCFNKNESILDKYFL